MRIELAIATMTDCAVARALARTFALRAGLTERASAEIAIAAGELASNIVKHGGGAGRLKLRTCRRGVHLIAVDAGPGLQSPNQLLESRGMHVEPGSWREGLGCGGGALKRLLDHVKVSNRFRGGLKVHGLKHFRAASGGSE